MRSPASTLRKIKANELEAAPQAIAACEGEFAFRAERRHQFRSLAQNCSICAKEEPQAIEQTSKVYLACCEVSLAATRRNLPGCASDTLCTTPRSVHLIGQTAPSALRGTFKVPRGAIFKIFLQTTPFFRHKNIDYIAPICYNCSRKTIMF